MPARWQPPSMYAHVMSVIAVGAPASPSVAPLRGSPHRHTDFMEQFQLSYIRAVAAAAGCVIVGEPAIDEGIDVILSHRSSSHQGSGPVYLELQLKSTQIRTGPRPKYVKSKMRADRYAEFTDVDPNVHRILVIMTVPTSVDEWVEAGHKRLAIRHCGYWANLRGLPDSTAVKPTVKALTSNIFDDTALCGIMARIGQGGTP